MWGTYRLIEGRVPIEGRVGGGGPIEGWVGAYRVDYKVCVGFHFISGLLKFNTLSTVN